MTERDDEEIALEARHLIDDQQTLPSDQVAEWIRNHIKQRECDRFTPVIAADGDNGSTNSECQCGHRKSSHSSSALINIRPQDKWTKETHTKQCTTNAFGEIKFVGYGGNIDNYSKFIRVDVDTNMSDMISLMTNVWKMDEPKLLISVTGGGKPNFCHMHKRLKESFRRGLRKIALTTGAWVITGGTHTGVMKHVGEAVKDVRLASGSPNKVIAIGIAPWGCIQNRKVLNGESYKGKWPADYRMDQEQRSKESFLDPNHSHFILCDDGTEHKFDIAYPFRAKLENQIALRPTNTGDNERGGGDMDVSGVASRLSSTSSIGSDISAAESLSDAVPVPIVLLVLGGGPGTLAKVHQSIQDNTPAVIVKGSGTAADILAYAYQNAKEKDIEAQDQEGKKQKKTSRFMDDSLEVEIKKMVDKAFGGADTSVHIDHIKECLDCSDLMSLFELDNRAGSQDIDVAMLKALLNANKGQEMVQLQLALEWNRIDLAKSEIFTDDKRWPTGSLDDIMFSAIQQNRVDFVKLFLDHGVSLGEFLTEKRLLMLYNNEIPQNCLLRKELAKIKAKADSDAIAGALFANGLLKAMKCKTTQDMELTNKMQAHIVEWSDLSIGVLSECYSTDDKKAEDLLVRELPHWGKATCMMIAVKADNKEFISQTACQQRLDRIWNGKIVLENSILNRNLLILLCLLSFPLTIWCIRFNFDDPDADSGQQKEEAVLGNNTKQEDGKSPFKKQVTSLRTVEGETKRCGLNNVKKRFSYFFNAPVVIFLQNVISYITFLGLFSYVLVIDYNPTLSSTEITLMVWVFTIFMEEIRQVWPPTASTIRTYLQSYVTDHWNKLDILTIILFCIAVVLRFLPYDKTFVAARVCLAMNFVSFFLRLLHIFAVHKKLGPKLVMIYRMMKDLWYFVMIMMVFVMSFGIASHSILYPNDRLTVYTIIKVIRRPYWNIYGELFLDEIEGDPECTFDVALFSNGTYSRCPTVVGRYVVLITMGLYMLLANVLLLNLVIAMFSYTFTMVQQKSDKHWFYQRYSLIYEYYTRPFLSPPLIVLCHLYLLAKFLLGRFCHKFFTSEVDEDDDFRRKFSNEHELVQWEKLMAGAFHQKKEMMAFESMEYKIATRLDLLMGTVDQMQEQLEKKMEVILQALQPNSLGASEPPPIIPNVSQEKQYDTRPREQPPRDRPRTIASCSTT